jgi:DNA-binding transcriptional LysR family regulator
MQDVQRVLRRIKLRDFRVLRAVAQSGSMSKAGVLLAVSHPVISKTIRDLERALDVRLFDRTPQGVEPTLFGNALLECGTAMFDDLHRGLQRMEFLSDPTAGELRIGATPPLIEGPILAAIEALVSQYPRVKFRVTEGDEAMLHRSLHKREIDFAVSRTLRSIENDGQEIAFQNLFDEDLYVVAGAQNPWARRRKIELVQLLEGPWVMPPIENPMTALTAEGFRSVGLMPLSPLIVTTSIAVRLRLITTRDFLTMMAGSWLHFAAKRFPIAALRVRLPMKAQKIEIAILNNRMLNPLAKTFIHSLQNIVRPLANRQPRSSD